MMRNVYSLGLSQIDPKFLRIRIEDTTNRRNRSIHPESGLNYLRIFGLDRVINATGLPGKDDLVDNTVGVIDYERGYIMFPWYEPFNPPAEVVDAFLADDADPREAAFDYSSLARDEGLYLETLTDRIKEINHHYTIIVRVVNEQRICHSSGSDIIGAAKQSP
jgi:cell surface protein SprA